MSLTYVIADLHGRFDLLQAALGTIAEHASRRTFKIVTLGDYVDRGPHSRQVVGCLMAAQAAGTNLICLKGNHEYMMHQALARTWFASASRARWLSCWKRNGGESTLTSYGNAVPSDHLRWIKNLPTLHVDEHRIFVHAGVDPTKALNKQTDEFLLWHRYPESADIGYGKRHVVHGHTPHRQGPEKLSHRTNLDTLAWQTGRLVIAVFDDHTPGPATRYIELPGTGTASPAASDLSDRVPRSMVSAPRIESPSLAADVRKNDDPFRELNIVEKIGLRWTLRDIEAKRWTITPINPIHLEKLMALNLVEIQNSDPALTKAGLEALGASSPPAKSASGASRHEAAPR